MSDVISAHGGTVDRFVGDGVPSRAFPHRRNPLWLRDVVPKGYRLLWQRTRARDRHIALDVGFGTAKTLMRAFKRKLGVEPAQYRELRGARRLRARDCELFC